RISHRSAEDHVAWHVERLTAPHRLRVRSEAHIQSQPFKCLNGLLNPPLEIDHREGHVAYDLTHDEVIAVDLLPSARKMREVVPEALAAILGLCEACTTVQSIPAQRCPLHAIADVAALHDKERLC